MDFFFWKVNKLDVELKETEELFLLYKVIRKNDQNDQNKKNYKEKTKY